MTIENSDELTVEGCHSSFYCDDFLAVEDALGEIGRH